MRLSLERLLFACCSKKKIASISNNIFFSFTKIVNPQKSEHYPVTLFTILYARVKLSSPCVLNRTLKNCDSPPLSPVEAPSLQKGAYARWTTGRVRGGEILSFFLSVVARAHHLLSPVPYLSPLDPSASHYSARTCGGERPATRD